MERNCHEPTTCSYEQGALDSGSWVGDSFGELLPTGRWLIDQLAHTLYRDRVGLEEESPVSTETSRGIVKQPKKGRSAAGEPEEYITLKEVAKHNLSQDAWVIIDGKVFE